MTMTHIVRKTYQQTREILMARGVRFSAWALENVLFRYCIAWLSIVSDTR